MTNEFSAVIERDDDWFRGFCPEVQDANGQGASEEGCRANLAQAIKFTLEDLREGE